MAFPALKEIDVRVLNQPGDPPSIVGVFGEDEVTQTSPGNPFPVTMPVIADVRQPTDAPFRWRQFTNGLQALFEWYLNHGAGDVLVLTLDTDGNLLPSGNKERNLGALLQRWAAFFCATIDASGNVEFGSALTDTFTMRGTLQNTTSFQRFRQVFSVPGLSTAFIATVVLPVTMPNVNYIVAVTVEGPGGGTGITWAGPRIQAKTTTGFALSIGNPAVGAVNITVTGYVMKEI